MAASAATGVSSATVFGLFHTIQLISMQAYTGSEMPANAANVFKTIDEFLRGGPLNPAKFWNKMIANKSGSTIPVLSRLLQSLSGPTKAQTVQTMVSTQFIPKNPLIETGFFVLVIVLCILISILLVIFNEFSSKLGYCGSFFSSYMLGPLKRIFMVNLMVQAQLSGYIYFVLSCIKQKVLFQHLLDAGSTIEGVNTALYYLVFAYVTIYPISVCLFLLMSSESGLNNSEIKAHIGTLYSGLDVEKPMNAQFVTLFLLRRLIVGVTIAFFRTYYFLQLEILMVSSMFCLCFMLLYWPYKTLLNNVVEMLNECFVILTVYIMHAFSFFIPDRNVRHDIGWFYIGLVGVAFVLNLSVVIQKVVLFVLLKVKQFKAQRQLIRKKNVHAKLFSWQPLTFGVKGKRKISENMVVPIYILNSQDTKRNPENKIALHVIEEIDESGFQDSSKHSESKKNDSQDNESLYRRVVSGQQNSDYEGSNDQKQSSDRNLIEEISDLVIPITDSKNIIDDFVANENLYRRVVSGQITDYGSRNELKFYTDSKMIDDVGGLLLPRPSTGMSTEYENAKQIRSLTAETQWIENTRQNELTEHGTRIGFIENTQSSKNKQQFSQKQQPFQPTKKKQNLVNELHGSVSSDTESKKRNQDAVTLGVKKRSPIQDVPYPKPFEDEVISQIKRTREQAYELYGFDPSKTEEESKRKGGQTKPNDKLKSQSNRFSVAKQLAEIENENDTSKVHLPLGELGGWSDRQPNLDQDKTLRQPNQLIQYELSDRLRELERDILTPQNDREIKLFEEIENQNKAEVVFVKKTSIQFAQPFQEGAQLTSRSMEINDDEYTKGIRQASSRKYGAFPEPSRGKIDHQTHQTDSDFIRTRTEQQPTKSKFGQRVPFRSEFGDLVQQMTQLTETQNTGQQELKDGKQAQIRPKTRQNADTTKSD